MNTENIKNAILKEDNLNNVIEAISLLRQGLNEYQSNSFACSVMWTVLKTRRISEKQAYVIAKECEKEGLSFLWSILDRASCVALGIELPAEEVKAEEVKAEQTADFYEVEIKSGRSLLFKKAHMSAEEAAEIIRTYLAGDKSLKVRVKKNGELADYQPLLVANAKEEVEEIENIASSEVVGTQDEQTEEGKVGEAETLATSTSEEGVYSLKIKKAGETVFEGAKMQVSEVYAQLDDRIARGFDCELREDGRLMSAIWFYLHYEEVKERASRAHKVSV